jgi:hypothetical protein
LKRCTLHERFAKAPPAPENPKLLETMAYQLQTPGGKDLYALRKQVPEQVFGIIKSVLGFRQFLLCGMDRVRGEWSRVTVGLRLGSALLSSLNGSPTTRVDCFVADITLRRASCPLGRCWRPRMQ